MPQLSLVKDPLVSNYRKGMHSVLVRLTGKITAFTAKTRGSSATSMVMAMHENGSAERHIGVMASASNNLLAEPEFNALESALAACAVSSATVVVHGYVERVSNTLWLARTLFPDGSTADTTAPTVLPVIVHIVALDTQSPVGTSRAGRGRTPPDHGDGSEEQPPLGINEERSCSSTNTMTDTPVGAYTVTDAPIGESISRLVDAGLLARLRTLIALHAGVCITASAEDGAGGGLRKRSQDGQRARNRKVHPSLWFMCTLLLQHCCSTPGTTAPTLTLVGNPTRSATTSARKRSGAGSRASRSGWRRASHCNDCAAAAAAAAAWCWTWRGAKGEQHLLQVARR